MNFIKIKDIILPVKIANTPEEQAKGLMFYKWPPPAMVFVYSRPTINKMWMKNTFVPLDIIFCLGGKIRSIAKGEPHCEDLIGEDVPSDLVVELPSGMAKELSICTGMSVELIQDTFNLKNKIAAKYRII